MPDKQHNAISVEWETPSGQITLLTSLEDGENDALTAVIDGAAVTLSGKNCRYAVTDAQRERKGKKPRSVQLLAEFRFTVPLSRCQIIWKFEEARETQPDPSPTG